jgi:hypothetical protein
MRLDPGSVTRFAERYFGSGLVLKQDDSGVVGERRPISEVVTQLNSVMLEGGRSNEVDLVLMRDTPT